MGEIKYRGVWKTPEWYFSDSGIEYEFKKEGWPADHCIHCPHCGNRIWAAQMQKVIEEGRKGYGERCPKCKKML